jgi:hypothetical protein
VNCTSTAPAKGPADCLCEEHHALAAQLVLLDQVADEIGRVNGDTLRRDVDRAYDLVAHKVLPHEKAERILRARLAAHDCRDIEVDEDSGEARRLVARLAGLKVNLARSDTDRTRAEVRHTLYELHALTRLHFVDELRECERARHRPHP